MSIIEFLCPNGHELKAKPELIGKPGKCPHCGSKFVVPDPGDDDEEAEEESAEETPAPQPPPAKKPKEETFVFLCPNGHQLTGPISLRGKPGKCPHCDAKFRVPSDEDEEEEEPPAAPPAESSVVVSPPQTPSVPEASVVDDGIPVGSIVEDVDPATAAGLSGVIEFPEAEIEVEEDEPSPDSDANMRPPEVVTPTIDAIPTGDATPTDDATVDATAASSRPLQHTLATTFLQLWSTRRDGDVVELHLRDGAVISPQRFAKSLSRDAYAAFAEKTDDGSHTITLVAWDAIERINFRNMGGLPKDLFD